MKRQSMHVLVALTVGLLLMVVGAATAQQTYNVTVTNLTARQVFTPLLIVSHPHDTHLFEAGESASVALEHMAEGGDTSFLATELGMPGVSLQVIALTEPLPPGQSVTQAIMTDMENSHISVVGMLIPTNDAFVALNSLHVTETSVTVRVPAYDAGTEANDEACANIPGPMGVCEGEGFNANREGAEGFVHIHRGIHSILDLSANVYDWRNPVAQIMIEAQ